MAYQDLNKEILGFKLDSLTRGVERGMRITSRNRGVSASSMMATKIASFFSSSF